MQLSVLLLNPRVDVGEFAQKFLDNPIALLSTW